MATELPPGDALELLYSTFIAASPEDQRQFFLTLAGELAAIWARRRSGGNAALALLQEQPR